MKTISAILFLATATALAQGVPNVQARDEQNKPKWPKYYGNDYGFKHGRYDVPKPKDWDWDDRRVRMSVRDLDGDGHPPPKYDEHKAPPPQPYGEEKKPKDGEYKPAPPPPPQYSEEKIPEKHGPKPDKYGKDDHEEKPEKYDSEKKPTPGYQSGHHDKRDGPDGDEPGGEVDQFDAQGNRRGGGWRNAVGRSTVPVIGGVITLAVVMAALL